MRHSNTLARRLAPVAASVALAAALHGCARSASEQQETDQTTQAAEDALTAIVDSVAEDQPSSATVDRLLAQVRSASDEALRVFERSESQYANAPQAERDALMQVYIDRSRNLGRLTHAGVERAKALHAQGSAEEAQAILNDLERLGRANTGPPGEIVQMGRITGEAILRRVAEARASLASGEGEGDSPPENDGGV